MNTKYNYEEFYQRMTVVFRNDKAMTKWLQRLDTILRVLLYIAYPILLVVVFSVWANIGGASYGIYRMLLYVFVPGAGFAIVSILHILLGKKRPYQQWPIEPLIEKNTSGLSMPSRHGYSAAVISMCIWTVNPAVGAVYLALAAISAMLRVVGGIHYPWDVSVGLFLSIAIGSLLFVFA